MRLIDADSLNIRKYTRWFENVEDARQVERMIQEAPTITPPPNDPLTLQELREMEGDPVYDGLGFQWFVIDSVDDIDELLTEITMTDGTVFDTDEEGVDRTLERFYRRKPEEGTI